MTSGRISQRAAATPEPAQTMSQAYARHPAAAWASRGIVLALLGAALLGGCSDGGRPVSSRSATTGSTAAPEPQASSTGRSRDASPVDVVRRWVAVGDAMQVSGDTAEYAAMTPRCRPCHAFVSNVDAVYSNGGSARFAGSRIVAIDLEDDAPPTVVVTKDVPRTVIVRPNGAREVLPPGRTTLVVTLARGPSGDYLVDHFVIRP